MLKFTVILLLCAVGVFGAPFSLNVTKAAGCGKQSPYKIGEKVKSKIKIHDPVTGEDMDREYMIYIPTGYDETAELPVMLVYHGWGSHWTTSRQGYHPVGEPDKYMTIYVKGMDDMSGFGSKVSWNCGNAGDLVSCTSEANGDCYDSCNKIGKCSRCNSYTCVDDVHFTKLLLERILSELCIDTKRLYATGYSNGGQFMYDLAWGLPVFAAIAPLCGTPFAGNVRVPNQIEETALVHLHTTGDKTIPYNGGVSYEHWTYTAVKDITRMWADVHSCSDKEKPLQTPWDGKDELSCHAYMCPRDSVVHCSMSGGHTHFPSWGYAFNWWALSKYVRK